MQELLRQFHTLGALQRHLLPRDVPRWQRLGAALQASADGGAEAVKAAVLAQLEDFMGGTDLQDDVTLLIVERVA
jgi:serine phosphatase RsbU (regulator of sigma subunit)